MRNLEALKVVKTMCNFKTLSHFQVYKGTCDESQIFASCLGDYSKSIYVVYDINEKTYHLTIDYNSAVFKSFTYIFTKKFSQQVFESIQTIYLRKESEKND